MKNQSATEEPLVFEALEPRLLLDGDVTFAVGKDLVLIGDGANNSVLIDSPAPNVIRVTGIAGTTINGGANANSPWTGGIVVAMPLGNNAIEINGVECDRNITIETGGGDDTVDFVDTTVHGKTTIGTGGGGDDVTVDPCTFNNKFTLVTGSGADTMTIPWSVPATTFNGKVTLNTGAGQDRVDLQGVILNGKVKATFGPGADWLDMWACDIKAGLSAQMGKDNSSDQFWSRDNGWFGKLSLKTGAGADVIGIENDAGTAGFRQAAKIDTGSGVDLMGRTDTTVASKFALKMGDEADQLMIRDTEISGAMKLDGGKGNDTYQDDGGITLLGKGTLSFKGFEVFV